MIHTIFSLYEPPGREVGAYFSMPFGLGLFERGRGLIYLLKLYDHFLQAQNNVYLTIVCILTIFTLKMFNIPTIQCQFDHSK
jgi:hypothetical protein